MTCTVKDWQQTVIEDQQEMLGFFGGVDWDMYPKDKLDVLKRKVGVLLYGTLLEEKLEDVELKEDKMERKDKLKDKESEEDAKVKEQAKAFVDKMCKVIEEEGTQEFVTDDCSSERATYMTFIFVFWKDSTGNVGCWPVFRVPKDNIGLTASFIDLNCRVYSSWEDFLKNNQFPACEYCYPRDGKYYYTFEGHVAVDFGLSPEARTSKKFLNALDIASGGVAAAGTVVTLATLAFPVVAPLAAVSAVAMGGVSGYSIVRSSATLHDRRVHKQSIGLLDREARGCYISILASTIGFGASAATSATVRMTQSGRVMGKLTASAVTALNGGALVMNGVGMINSLHHLIEKYKEDQLTALDVAQFSASLLLFCHSTINFRTAQSIIENTQNNVINEFEEGLRSNRHRKVFKKGVKNTVKELGGTEGKALVIRTIKHIDNVDDFFASMVQTDKQVRYVKCKVAFGEGGRIVINNKVSLDPRDLAALNKDQRVTLLRATQKYDMNRMSDAKFNDIMNNIFKDIPTSSSSSSTNVPVAQLLNNIDVCVNGSQVTRNVQYLTVLLSASQLSELKDMLIIFSDQFQRIILKLSDHVCRILDHMQGSEFIEITQFVCKYVQHLLFHLVEGRRKYILAALKDKIRCVPPENMNSSEYCLALLEQLLMKPKVIADIFQCVRSFFCVLQGNFQLLQEEKRINFLELVSTVSVLVKMERPLWLRVIEFAQKVFRALDLNKFSSLVAIVKDLFLYIEQVVLNMEKRYESYRNNESDGSDNDSDSIIKINDPRYEDFSALAVESLEDAEVSKSLMDRICENNVDIFSDEMCSSSTLRDCGEYSQETPLILKKSFWSEGQNELMSENEILEVCKQLLKTDSMPSNYIVQCEGLKYLVVVNGKIVTIDCNVEANSVSAYIDATTLTNLNTVIDSYLVEDNSIETLEGNNHFEYTKDSSLILGKHFFINRGGDLLSEEEIINVCKEALKIHSLPQECPIDYDGLKILINIEGRVVVIDCDVEGDRLYAYVDPCAVLSNETHKLCTHTSSAIQDGYQSYYPKEVPLVITKDFGDGCPSELSEEEILNVFSETLKFQCFPQEYTVEYDDLKILVSGEGKVVVIEHDVETKRLYSYLESSVVPSPPVQKPCTYNDSDTSNNSAHGVYQYSFSQKDPLVIEKCFGDSSQSKLLAEEEIISICKIILCGEDVPQDASFEYYGSTVYVYFNDKVITIDCDINNGRIYAYMHFASFPS